MAPIPFNLKAAFQRESVLHSATFSSYLSFLIHQTQVAWNWQNIYFITESLQYPATPIF